MSLKSMQADLSDKSYAENLLTKLSQGDQLAFVEIYNKYRSRMYAYASNLCKSEETAEEIVQEVFIRLWQKREQINVELNFDAYIKKITLNHVLNYLKKAAREKTLQQEIFSYIETIRNTTEDNILERELVKTYEEAISKLPPQKKIIYQLSRAEDMTHDQIAEKLNISKNTVKNHMVEATRFIRHYVSQHGSIVCFIIAASNYFRSN